MIYDPATGGLWTSDGNFLKYLFCPMSIRWDDLGVASQQPAETLERHRDRARDCRQCGSHVISLEGLSDSEVTTVFMGDSSACVYLRTDWSNVTVLRAKNGERTSFTPIGHIAELSAEVTALLSDAIVRVHTARSREQMEAATAQGYGLVLQAVPDGTAKHWKTRLVVWYNKRTGEVWEARGRNEWLHPTDRFDWDDEDGRKDWTRALEINGYYPHKWSNAYAAYVVPKHLPPGTLVLLTDPIKDIVAWSHHGVIRALMVPAVWTGTDFEFRDDDIEVPAVVG